MYFHLTFGMSNFHLYQVWEIGKTGLLAAGLFSEGPSVPFSMGIRAQDPGQHGLPQRAPEPYAFCLGLANGRHPLE